MFNKYSSSDGYAVTEILLAVVIISIAFIEITRAYANISNYATSAISLSQSSNLAIKYLVLSVGGSLFAAYAGIYLVSR